MNKFFTPSTLSLLMKVTIAILFMSIIGMMVGKVSGYSTAHHIYANAFLWVVPVFFALSIIKSEVEFFSEKKSVQLDQKILRKRKLRRVARLFLYSGLLFAFIFVRLITSNELGTLELLSLLLVPVFVIFPLSVFFLINSIA